MGTLVISIIIVAGCYPARQPHVVVEVDTKVLLGLMVYGLTLDVHPDAYKDTTNCLVGGMLINVTDFRTRPLVTLRSLLLFGWVSMV